MAVSVYVANVSITSVSMYNRYFAFGNIFRTKVVEGIRPQTIMCRPVSPLVVKLKYEFDRWKNKNEKHVELNLGSCDSSFIEFQLASTMDLFCVVFWKTAVARVNNISASSGIA
jgi:hypothetical protein